MFSTRLEVIRIYCNLWGQDTSSQLVNFSRKSHSRPHNYTKTKAAGTLKKKAGRVALMCDASTSIPTDSYVTVTAHFINNGLQLISHVC